VIASGVDVIRIDHGGNILWRSELLAIDGVIIDKVLDGVIYGAGNHDPPDGWRDFRISISDGTPVAVE
jgi:hypothetical protein